MSQIGRQFPAQVLSNPVGYGLLSPLMMALNHVFSDGRSVIALCVPSRGRHLTYLSAIPPRRRSCDQCVACCCSPERPGSAAAHSGLTRAATAAAHARRIGRDKRGPRPASIIMVISLITEGGSIANRNFWATGCRAGLHGKG